MDPGEQFKNVVFLIFLRMKNFTIKICIIFLNTLDDSKCEFSGKLHAMASNVFVMGNSVENKN